MDETPKVDRLEHDKVVLLANLFNRRMFLAVVTVCLTFALIIVAYTIREKNFIDALVTVKTGVTDVQQNRNAEGP